MLAIIPARGGSKEIPGKNLALVGGKPLIYYSITSALLTQEITEIIVSSDDEKILREAEKLGVCIDYQRPKELSLDNTSMPETLLDVIIWAERRRGKDLAKELVLLQPTSPLRTSEDIKKAIKEYREKRVKSLVTINHMKEHPNECVEIKNGSWSYIRQGLEKEKIRQDYVNNFFYINGAVYIVDIKWFLKYQILLCEKETAFSIMPRERSIDIDDRMDLAIARTFIENKFSHDEL